MNVVIDTTAHPGGGSVTYLSNLLERVAGGNDRFTVIVPPGRNALSDRIESNIKVVETAFPIGNVMLRELYRQIVLPILLLRADPDLLFSTGDVTSLLSPCPIALMVHNPNPYVDTDLKWSVIERIKFRFLRLLTGLSTLRAHEIAFVSAWSRDAALEFLPIDEDATTVIHHGVRKDSPHVHKEDIDGDWLDRISDAEPYILTVSTVLPHKNYEALLRGLARADTPGKRGYSLLIAGRRPSARYEAELRDLMSELDLKETVEILGRVPDDVLQYLYREAELYVLPSKLETFGMTPLEAMAAGTPVIAGDSTAIPEICGDGAEYFDPDDPDDLARKIDHILTDMDRKRALVEAGLERVESFDWDDTAAETVALLRRAAEEGH